MAIKSKNSNVEKFISKVLNAAKENIISKREIDDALGCDDDETKIYLQILSFEQPPIEVINKIITDQGIGPLRRFTSYCELDSDGDADWLIEQIIHKYFLNVPMISSPYTQHLQIQELYELCGFSAKKQKYIIASTSASLRDWFEDMTKQFFWLYLLSIKLLQGYLPTEELKKIGCTAVRRRIFRPEAEMLNNNIKLLQKLCEEVLKHDSNPNIDKIVYSLQEKKKFNPYFLSSEEEKGNFIQVLDELRDLRNKLSHSKNEESNVKFFTPDKIVITKKFSIKLADLMGELARKNAYPRIIAPVIAEADQWGRHKIYFLDELDYTVNKQAELTIKDQLYSSGVLDKKNLKIMYTQLGNFTMSGGWNFYCFNPGDQILNPDLLPVDLDNENDLIPLLCPIHRTQYEDYLNGSKEPDQKENCIW